MGLVPPPLQPHDVRERIRDGARTLEEIDPEFYKWSKRHKYQRLFSYILAAISITMAILSFIIQ